MQRIGRVVELNACAVEEELAVNSPRAIIVIALIFLGACSQSSTEPVRVGVLLWPPYDLGHLAKAEGYVRPSEVRLIDYQTPAEVVRAYRNGLIDAFFLTTQFALGDHLGRPDTRIVHTINISRGGDSLLARPEIESLEQLNGRTIALEAGPLGNYMLQRALDHTGLSYDDVELRPVDTPGHVSAYLGGQVDAVITYEPFRSRVLAAGAIELFSTRDIPDEIIDVLFVAGDVVDSRPAALVELVQGIERSRQLLDAEPDRALDIMADRHGLSAVDFAQALDGAHLLDLDENLALLSGDPSPLVDSINEQLQVFTRAGLLPPGSRDPVTATASIVTEASR